MKGQATIATYCRRPPQPPKQCQECGATFTKNPKSTHAQWAKQQCCTPPCANALRARGRPKAIGDLDRRALGSKAAWQRAWAHRKAMPYWAAWWEEQRRAEDAAEIAAPVVGGPCSPIRAKPNVRRFIMGWCPDDGQPNVVERRRWHDSIRCLSCTKRRWQGNHRQRAKQYGVDYEHIDISKVFASDRYRCQLCGRKTKGKFPSLASPTLDHIIPMSRGGPHLQHNVQTACFKCNMEKYAGSANDQLRLALH